jgi:hypothetical protein
VAGIRMSPAWTSRAALLANDADRVEARAEQIEQARNVDDRLD